MAGNLLVALLLLGCVAVAAGAKCHMYCEGNDDPTGACQKAHEKKTCTGDACIKVHWKGSDTYWRGCHNKDDPGGLYVGKCVDGKDEKGKDIKACQCDGELCNGAPLLTVPLLPLAAVLVRAALGHFM